VSGLASPQANLIVLNRLRAKAREAYGKLPLGFGVNRGHIDAKVNFLTRIPGYVSNEKHQVVFYMAAPYGGKHQVVDARAVYSALAGDEEGCAMILAQVALACDGPEPVSQAAPPPPGRVPPNTSRIIATVLKDSLWPPGSLENTLPPVPPDQTLYSVTLEIHASDPERSNLDSLAVPGAVIEAFSPEVLASDLVGKKLQAVVTLTGDTSGVRWWISNVRSVP
jgi:hypothetical protein